MGLAQHATGRSADLSLSGRCVLITGAASGIGRATALMASSAGARIIATDVDGADQVAEEAGLGALAFKLDVSSASRWREVVARVRLETGAIDGLVNAAGIAAADDSLSSQSEAGWNRIIDVNLKGVFLGMQAVLPSMLDAAHGRIVNLSSNVAISAMPRCAAYAASKAGIIGLSRQVSIEYAAQGLRVNVVAPGIVDTPMLGAASAESVDAMRELTPIQRIGRPEEIASLICHLLSPAGDYITGQTLVIDGGWSAR